MNLWEADLKVIALYLEALNAADREARASNSDFHVKGPLAVWLYDDVVGHLDHDEDLGWSWKPRDDKGTD